MRNKRKKETQGGKSKEIKRGKMKEEEEIGTERKQRKRQPQTKKEKVFEKDINRRKRKIRKYRNKE